MQKYCKNTYADNITSHYIFDQNVHITIFVHSATLCPLRVADALRSCRLNLNNL